MRIAGYIRVSTEEQAEKGFSLDEQRERLISYCKAMGWPTPTIYEDDGYSAKDLRRPELTRLLGDVKTEKYTLIITTKLDRLSRRLFDILSVIDYLEKHNCSYVSASESFDTTTPAGRMTLQMLGMVAEFERERISERVRDNMRAIARKGEKIISRPCYGYNVKNGIMEINIEEALVVKQMAKWALEGHGAWDIAKRLNDRGIATKDGKQWHDRVVRALLKRETLVGDFVYNRTYRKGTRIFTRPEEEWIRIENHHDPILDRDTFDAIQKIFQSRKQSASRYVDETNYLLTGLLVCTHCGGKMVGRKDSKRGKNIYYRYVCNTYMKKGGCYFHHLHRDDLESVIINEIKRITTADANNLEITVVKTNSAKKTNKTDIYEQLHKLDLKAQRQIEAYEDDLITAHDLKKAKERIEKDRTRLLEQLKELERSDQKNGGDVVRQKAKRLIDDILSLDRAKSKNAIRQLIHHVDISNASEVVITWHAD
ncbi:recombinase family protein [Brevibacillus agri]|uniref:recombinase family protein n=1 Tax=Brevibacillus agri TaxID=51101 RepID=UPI001C8F113D|nr:recombinase family protein [Brevibacillus agri]MBY0052330.1 recombinase family protein [Brevibacillus agri]